MGWNNTGWAWITVAALMAGCTETSSEAGGRTDNERGQPGQSAGRRYDEGDAAGGARRDTGAEFDLATDAGRRAAFERLKGDYEGVRARLDGAAQDVKLVALRARQDGLRELQKLCDDLERHLDELEDASGEQWTKTRSQVLDQAQRLRLECERILGQEP